MRRKLIIFGIALLAIINISALGTIGYHRWCPLTGEREACNPARQNYLYQELSLSQLQQDKMDTIKQSFHFQADKIGEQLLAKRTELVDLLKTSLPDSDRIHQLLNEIGALQNELQQQVIYSLLQEKEILNPAQQEQFILILKQRLIQQTQCHQSSELNSFDNNNYQPNCTNSNTN